MFSSIFGMIIVTSTIRRTKKICIDVSVTHTLKFKSEN